MLSNKMNFLQQPNNKTCGHTCIAMIANTSVEDAIKVIDHNSGTHGTHLIKALNHYGIKNSGKSIRIKDNETRLPNFAIVRIQHDKSEKELRRRLKQKQWYGHWIVVKDGFVYDPSWAIVNGVSVRPASWSEYSQWLKNNKQHITSYIEIIL